MLEFICDITLMTIVIIAELTTLRHYFLLFAFRRQLEMPSTIRFFSIWYFQYNGKFLFQLLSAANAKSKTFNWSILTLHRFTGCGIRHSQLVEDHKSFALSCNSYIFIVGQRKICSIVNDWGIGFAISWCCTGEFSLHKLRVLWASVTRSLLWVCQESAPVLKLSISRCVFS